MADVITKELVDLSLAGRSSEEVIKNLASRIDMADRLTDFEKYYESVIERELLTSTGIGFGIAIPHGKCSQVKECTVAFGRLEEPVEWNSLDGNPVEMVFLLAVPEECAGNEHLKIIAGLSRRLVHEDFREMLKNTEDEEAVEKVIMESLAGLHTGNAK